MSFGTCEIASVLPGGTASMSCAMIAAGSSALPTWCLEDEGR
jgi:hypothetical protein